MLSVVGGLIVSIIMTIISIFYLGLTENPIYRILIVSLILSVILFFLYYCQGYQKLCIRYIFHIDPSQNLLMQNS